MATPKPTAPLTIFYDGGCPLCAREIAFYRRCAGAGRLDWIDVAAWGAEDAVDGLSKATALARFHVMTADGRFHQGGRAFARLWCALPAFRLFGWLGLLPPVAWALDRGYDYFLPLRPRLQAWFKNC